MLAGRGCYTLEFDPANSDEGRLLAATSPLSSYSRKKWLIMRLLLAAILCSAPAIAAHRAWEAAAVRAACGPDDGESSRLVFRRTQRNR